MKKNTTALRKKDHKIILTTFLVNVSDIFINLFAAYLTGSVVMLTQTLQGMSDVFASGLTLYGLRRSRKANDYDHPYGYGREIYFWAAAAGIVMFTLSAGAAFYFGFKRFLNPESIENVGVALTVLTIALITNGYSFSGSVRRVIDKNNVTASLQAFMKSSLVSSKIALILDFYGTLSSIIGITALSLYVMTGVNRFDGLGAMVIAFLLAILTLLLFLNIKDLIVGRRASTKIEKSIRSAVMEVSHVLDVLDLNTMIIGPEKILVDLEVHLEDGLDTDQIEKITDTIKVQVQRTEPSVADIMVEIETPDSELAG